MNGKTQRIWVIPRSRFVGKNSGWKCRKNECFSVVKYPNIYESLFMQGESSQCIFCEEAVTAWNLTKKKNVL